MHAGPYSADSWLRNGILENFDVTIVVVVEELILGLWYPYYYKCFCENTLLLIHTYIMFFSDCKYKYCPNLSGRLRYWIRCIQGTNQKCLKLDLGNQLDMIGHDPRLNHTWLGPGSDRNRTGPQAIPRLKMDLLRTGGNDQRDHIDAIRSRSLQVN